jgi:glucokinase-like ROK family protein
MVENGTQAAILESLLRAGAPVTRATLGAQLCLGRNALGTELRRLTSLGLVEERGADPSNGGRPSRRLHVPRSAGLLAAIDIGGSSIDVALTTLTSELVAYVAVPATLADGPDVVLSRAFELVERLETEGKVEKGAIRAVGVDLPGPVDQDGDASAPPIPDAWSGYPIRSTASERFGVPAFVENDANVMALGEHLRGVARGVDNFVLVKVGMGIGAGIMSEGRLVRGAGGGAGELGHVVIAPESGVVCTCGNVGCLQAFVGAPGIVRAAEEAVAEGRSPLLAAIRERDGALAAADVALAAGQADPAAIAIVRDAGRLLGSALADTVSLLNPAMVVLAGGVVGLGDAFLAEIRTTVYRRSLPLATRNLPILRTGLGPHVGVVGASVLAARGVLATYAQERAEVAHN